MSGVTFSGPLIAGFINYNVNWRWTYYVLLIWSGVELVLVYIFVVETYKPELLRRKAVRSVRLASHKTHR